MRYLQVKKPAEQISLQHLDTIHQNIQFYSTFLYHMDELGNYTIQLIQFYDFYQLIKFSFCYLKEMELLIKEYYNFYLFLTYNLFHNTFIFDVPYLAVHRRHDFD